MRTARRRRPTELTLLRPVPGTSPIHRLWAGTKLISLTMIALVLSFRPQWPAIGMGAALVAAGLVVARIPRGALPRLPRWFWIAFAVGAALTLRSAAVPLAHVAGVTVSLGGLEQWTRVISLTIVVLAAAALVSWTTSLAEVAPALSRLGTPLKWLRLPVDEWATAVALSIRCLPILMDEVRTMTAARKLRPNERRRGQSKLDWYSREAQDLLLASLSVSIRRANEMGEAVEARGGFGVISDSHSRPGWWDAVALGVVVGVCAAAAVW
jgi:energy-coupling factor transporter transmembrane protein EcfT